MDMIGNSEAMKAIRDVISCVAETDATVLITGETGTGKDLVARAIHEQSPRRTHPFVAVNCIAVNKDLIESELFGHVKGAFTGAYVAREGLFAHADSGTIFLDEISHSSPIFQGQLLRLLESKEYRPVGSSATKISEARVIAASNEDFNHAISSGSFRRDLYYRLGIVNIHIPPLRKRQEDIGDLIDYFSKSHSTKYKRKIEIDSGAKELMIDSCKWPGNIRQLNNFIEGKVASSREPFISTVDVYKIITKEAQDDLLLDNLSDDCLVSEKLEDIEINLIQEALVKTNGVITQAAKLIGMRRTTLSEKMKRYGIKSPRELRAIS